MNLSASLFVEGKKFYWNFFLKVKKKFFIENIESPTCDEKYNVKF